MIYGVYAVKDELSGMMTPTFETRDEVAIRNFAYAIQKADSFLYSNSKDFSIWKLGTFDSETGIILSDPKLLALASSLKGE